MKSPVCLPASLCLLTAALAAPARAADDHLYERIANAYMTGKFDDLSQALREAPKRMGELSAEQKADVLYVRQALGECRPAWWGLCKKGQKKVRIRQKLWGRTLRTVYDPQGDGGIKVTPMRIGVDITVSWKPEDMDSTAAGKYGYLQGDMTCVGVWSNLMLAGIYASFPMQTLARMDERGKLRFNRYSSFRSNLTTLYHSTPPARRYALHIYFASFYYDKWGSSPVSGARRAVCAMAMGEILKDPSLYPSLRLPSRLPAENAEEALGQHYKHAIKRGSTWTIAEDRRFREALKPFAAANDKAVYQSEKVTLPSKLVFAIDVDVDKPYRAKRDAWIKQQFDKARAAGE